MRKPYRKYRNNPVFVTPDGTYVGRQHQGQKRKCFDSEKEFKRFLALREEQRLGLISGLRTQKRFWLHGPFGTRLTSYVADFVYVRDGQLVVEDVKSDITAKMARWKMLKAWMKDEYGITVLES